MPPYQLLTWIREAYAHARAAHYRSGQPQTTPRIQRLSPPGIINRNMCFTCKQYSSFAIILIKNQKFQEIIDSLDH